MLSLVSSTASAAEAAKAPSTAVLGRTQARFAAVLGLCTRMLRVWANRNSYKVRGSVKTVKFDIISTFSLA